MREDAAPTSGGAVGRAEVTGEGSLAGNPWLEPADDGRVRRARPSAL